MTNAERQGEKNKKKKRIEKRDFTIRVAPRKKAAFWEYPRLPFFVRNGKFLEYFHLVDSNRDDPNRIRYRSTISSISPPLASSILSLIFDLVRPKKYEPGFLL